MSRPPLSRRRSSLAELKAYRVPPEPPPIKLDANESPWPLPEDARRTLAEALAALPLHRYPDGLARGLRSALAAHLDAPEEGLLLGVGSDECITMLYGGLAKPGPSGEAVVLFPGPTFVMYAHTARAHGLVPVEVPLADDWTLDPEAMHAALERHRPNLVFYASPNNPTGNAFDPETIRALADAHPETLHVVDEAYGPFHRDRPEEPAKTLRPWVAERPQVAVMSTLSKCGLAGARLGWLYADPAFVAELEKVRQPFNLNALTQEAARLALTDLAPVIEEQLRAIVRERAVLRGALEAIEGLHVWPSDANFLLVRVPGDAVALRERLWAEGIAVRVFASHPRLAGHLRLTVGTPDENAALVDALRRAL